VKLLCNARPGVVAMLCRLLVIAWATLFILSTTGCSFTFPWQQQSYHTHTVTQGGETLNIIAEWYTGNYANWHRLLEHNPNLTVNNIRIGDKVNIPKGLLVTTKGLPVLPKRPVKLVVVKAKKESKKEASRQSDELEALEYFTNKHSHVDQMIETQEDNFSY